MSNPFIQSIKDSGPFGLSILALLLIASILSWSTIVWKFSSFRQAYRSLENLRRTFSASGAGAFNLPLLSPSTEPDPAIDVYRQGCAELKTLAEAGREIAKLAPEEWEQLAQKLHRTADDRTGNLESGLIILASSASTGPLLGILGTVYGVLITFQGMGRHGSATIEAVAPGISEALITTVIGLIVAIPALIAYNYFHSSLKKFSAQLDSFIADLLERARRDYDRSPAKGTSVRVTPRPVGI